MDFHKQYRDMNENITPSDTLVQQTIAKMESGRPHRARKPLKIILAVAAALACVSTAVAANQEAVLRVLYQIAPGMAEYLQPVGQVCEDRGVKLEVVSADVEGSTAKVYLSLTDPAGSVFGDAAPDMYDSWHLDYPRLGRTAPLSCGCSTVDYDPSTRTATYFLQIDDLGGDVPAGPSRRTPRAGREGGAGRHHLLRRQPGRAGAGRTRGRFGKMGRPQLLTNLVRS